MEDEDIDMETVHDSQAFIHHQLNLLDRPSTPGKHIETTTTARTQNTTTGAKPQQNGVVLFPPPPLR